jgi:competence protein ComEC
MRLLTVVLLAAVWVLAVACDTSSGARATPTPALSSEELVKVTFFDVGESGDGFLVSTREGRHMLIDGGRRESGMAGLLREEGVSRLDVVMATNPDADHIGGLIEVLRTIPVGEVWMSNDTNTTRTFEDFLDAVEASEAVVEIADRGDVIQLGSISIPVLNPFEPYFSDRNNNSVTVRLEVGRVSFLFTGDIEKKAEERLVESGANLKSTILKLGHHGSSTSSRPSFVSAVEPEAAVYQAGVGNRYGHPHTETLLTLERFDVKVYGTGKNGKIVIRTDGNTYTLETER